MDPNQTPDSIPMADMPWLGRGRGLQLQDVVRGRGLMPGLGPPPPGPTSQGRGLDQFPTAAGGEPAVGGLGRGAGLFLPPKTPPTVGVARGAPLPSMEPLGGQVTEENPV